MDRRFFYFKRLISVFVMLCLSLSVFAGGKKEVMQKSVGTENSWTEVFDIQNRSGKYNVYAEATDKAGNTAVAGPYNLFIDDESDLPVITITNPTMGMKVPGNLNIVGTCVDDDMVSEVWLILDGDKENPILVEGTNFWSYYLDTTKLPEGRHTITAYGIDNGNPAAYYNDDGVLDESKVKPKTGRAVTIDWQLCREAPVTSITNLDMGALISGKVSLAGKVTDGNGIDTLEYSVDGGEHYTPIKVKQRKLSTPDENGFTSEYTFSLPLDTRKMDDGPKLIWFKAVDGAGTVGINSFLCFIDNEQPELKIVTPEIGETVNGIFTIAGYAKDTNGIKSLKYKWGSLEGEFELTAGNSYWALELDSRIVKNSMDFTISTEDTMGNAVTASRFFMNSEKGVKSGNVVYVNQSGDKPTIDIKYPVGEVDADNGTFIRGLAQDDDGVAAVYYSVDGGPEVKLETTGVFYNSIPGALTDGEHRITAYAVDKFGVKGDPSTVTFSSKGYAPVFTEEKYGDENFVNGMEINPESGKEYTMKVASSTGLKSVHYDWTWGANGIISKDIEGNDAKELPITIGFGTADIPWGVSKLTVTATDHFDRSSIHTVIFNVADYTKFYGAEPGLYFTDSTVASDGAISVDATGSVSGYFVGGKIASLTTVPAVKGVGARVIGNTIVLTSTAATPVFKLRVTTASGGVYTSQNLYFPSQETAPVIKLTNDNSLVTEVFNNFSTKNVLSIAGTVASTTDPTVRYRILTAKVNYDENGTVISSQVVQPTKLENSPLIPVRRGAFTLNLAAENFEDGVSVVEIIATNSSGKTSSTAVLVRKIAEPVSPELLGENAAEPAQPAYYWLHGDGPGMGYYGVCVYQGVTGSNFDYKSYESLPVGESTITFKSASMKVTKPATGASGYFASVDGSEYRSGMEVLEDKDGTIDTDPHSLVARIMSESPVTSVVWTANGTALPEGTVRETGENGVYEAEVPISGLPAGLVKISALVNGSTTVSGTVCVLRTHGVVDDQEGIYWTTAGGAVFDAANNRYVLNNDASLVGYANVPGKISASLMRSNAGLQVSVDGKLIKVSATSDGLYSNISVRAVSDANGAWASPTVAIIADTANPTLNVTSVKPMDYIKEELVIAGTVADGNGIASLEYTTMEDSAGDESDIVWKPIKFDTRGRFGEKVSLADSPDGYVPLTVRAKDNAGKVSYFNSAIRKDTTPPEVTIVVPEPGAVVNGETLFVFRVKDDSYVGNIQYISPDGKTKKDFILAASDSLSGDGKQADAKSDNPGEENPDGELSADAELLALSKSIAELDAHSNVLTGSLPSTALGQEGLPIANTMKFIASDVAGNTAVVDTFDFTVDPDSDLPVVEIHMPLEESVNTTDFVISGVMYDDDGLLGYNGETLRAYYKIDDSDFQLIPNENAQASFEIKVSPLNILKDNEHTVVVYGEDINGVKGKAVSRKFYVSLEEPKGSVELPKIDGHIHGLVTMSGWAKDKNGINRVQISVDNGASYNDAVVVPGKTREDPAQWTYEFDTRVVQDGTHVVYLKIWDGYNITGLYTSLLNIDNTSPELELELPLDDSTISRNLVISGQTTDNIELTELYMRIKSLDGNKVPDYLAENDLYPESIVSQVIDVSELSDGLYNVEISGYDKAGNSANVSRNIHIVKEAELTSVDLLYPLNGEYVNGEFNIYGTAKTFEEEITSIDIVVDGQRIPGLSTTLTDSGYFSFRMKPEIVLDKANFSEEDLAKATANMEARTKKNTEGAEAVAARNAAKKSQIEAAKAAAAEAGKEYTGPEYEEEVYEPIEADVFESGTFNLVAGTHTYKVIAHTSEGRTVESRTQSLNYNPYGPWVTLDNFMYGDFAVDRPILRGNAGYALTNEEKAALKDKKLPTEEKMALKAKTVKQVFLSFDNGKTYTPVSSVGKGSWKHRIENQDVAEGFHFLLVRAEMENGESAITRTIVQVDRTLPNVKLISPGAGGHYNQLMRFEGLSSDDVDLDDVTLYLRRGDRSAYEVPKFIQGLYFDTNFWGASLWSAGVGLTAFDNAVKIQLSYGQFTQDQRNFFAALFNIDESKWKFRYGGHIVSAKVIAQIANIPFNYFFGHDFDWLSATVSIGANFSWFSQSAAALKQNIQVSNTILTSALMQVEFPKMTFKDNAYFKTWAVYYEPSIWFIPSDVASDKIPTLVPQFSIGLRTSLF